MTPEESDNLRDEVLSLASAATLMERVVNGSYANSFSPAYDVVVFATGQAHNTGSIDLLPALAAIAGDQQASHQTLRRAARFFAAVMPHLQADTQTIVDVVVAFTEKPGENGSQYGLPPAFLEWCRASPSRPDEALAIILSNTAKYGGMILFALEAGAFFEPAKFAEKAIELTASSDRHTAVSSIGALGGMDLSSTPDIQAAVMELLALKVRDGEDDGIVAMSLSALATATGKGADEATLLDVLKGLKAPLGGDTQIALAQVLWRTKNIENFEFRCSLLAAAKLIDLSIPNLVAQLDVGLSEITNEDNVLAIGDYVAEAVANSGKNLHLTRFQSLLHELQSEQPELLGKLLVHWMLTAPDVVRQQAGGMLREVNDEAHTFNVDFASMKLSAGELAFVCRKVLAYMLMTPVAAASIVLSALRHATDEERPEIAELIFWPLMINSSKAQAYLERRVPSETPSVQKALNSVIARAGKYLKQKRSVGEMRELHPSEHARAVQRERTREQARATFRAARERSAFAAIVPMSVILHGNGSVSYSDGKEGGMQRNTMPLNAFSAEIEMPRMEVLDPVGLQWMIYTFRTEERPS